MTCTIAKKELFCSSCGGHTLSSPATTMCADACKCEVKRLKYKKVDVE